MSLRHPLFVGWWGSSPGDVVLADEHRRSTFRHEGEVVDEPALATDDNQATVQGLLSAWGFATDASMVPVLMLPYPIAILVCTGMWSELLLLARWHQDVHTQVDSRVVAHLFRGPIAGWPPASSVAWSRPHFGRGKVVDDESQEAEGGIDALTHHALDQIASDVQRWSKIVLATVSPDDADGERLVFEDTVPWGFGASQDAGVPFASDLGGLFLDQEASYGPNTSSAACTIVGQPRRDGGDAAGERKHHFRQLWRAWSLLH